MKKTIFLFLIFLSLLSNAQKVGKDEASVAAKFFLTSSEKNTSYSVKSFNEIQQLNTIAYLFSLSPDGFIIVPADKNLPPVLAYSFENDFGNISNDNPLLALIKADVLSRLKYFSENNISGKYENEWNALPGGNKSADSTFQQWPAVGDGWLKTNWTQDAPYDDLCPIDPVTAQRSIAGCPAVAMAQILNFHKTTNDTHFDDGDDYYHNYAGRQYMIDDDYAAHGFPSFPELNNYLDTLNAHYYNNVVLTDTDKAALTFACGVAATQVYTSGGSGTFSVSQALDAYLRFGFSTATLLDSNDADLFGHLKQNIKDTLPAHLAVVDSAWSTGHNVVVDGYNTDEYYHLNFGWGGSYNGWYQLPQGFPFNLTVIEGVIADIIKPNVASVNEMNTGINDDATLYPNPTSGIIYFSFGDPSKIKCIEILDLQGKEMYTYSSSASQINISDLAKGIYFVKIVDDKESRVEKVLKQ